MNSDIKEYAKGKGVFLWQIADCIGITDGNFSKKLRHELSAKERDKILAIIDDIALTKEQEN